MRDVSVWVVGVCVLAMVGLVALPAQAELVTINIEGVVDTVEDDGYYLEDQIHVGDIITGWYTYDTDTPDTNPADEVAHYQHDIQPAGITLNVGGLEFKTDYADVDFLVGITNDGTSGGLHDSYWIVSYSNTFLPNGSSVDLISWQLDDPTASAISSTNLSETAPVLQDWQSIYGLRVEGERGGYAVVAHVTSAVPEPATLLLFAIGATISFRKGA